MVDRFTKPRNCQMVMGMSAVQHRDQDVDIEQGAYRGGPSTRLRRESG